jgi:GH25 family lysozyme M1 (1,4-beta-N-acetylmuramidase)
VRPTSWRRYVSETSHFMFLASSSRRDVTIRALVALFSAAGYLVTVRAEAVVQGIDVSHYQGAINWSSVKNAGIQFAFCKATEGVDFVDSRFTANMSGAIAAGIPIGPYHFARPDSFKTNPLDPVNEANDFVDAIQSYYNGASLVLRPVLDLETLSGQASVSAEKAFLSDWTRDFAGVVETRLGVKPIIYVNGNFANNYLESNISQFPLWFAKPTTNIGNNFAGASPPTRSNIGIWTRSGWDFWQWSWTGNVGGINPVDRNAFDGTLLELAQQFSPNYSDGDYNHDGTVDAGDYILWRNTLGQHALTGSGADGDLSGTIDLADYDIWKNSFGKTVTNAGASNGAIVATAVVPESSTLALALMLAFSLASYRRAAR